MNREGGQFGIAYRVLNILVPKVGLHCARVVSRVGEREATGVSQHVRMDLQPELGGLRRPLNHPRKAGCGEGCASLANEHERAGLVLPLQAAKRSDEAKSAYNVAPFGQFARSPRPR